MDRRMFTQTVAGWSLWLTGCADATPIQTGEPPRHLLLLTETEGFRHDSIPTAVETIRALGTETGAWRVAERADSAAEVARAVTADSLRDVQAVVFANTTGRLSFTPEGRAAFYRWMREGGACVGVHSAADTFHDDPEFLDLLRGEFRTHGPETRVEVHVQDPDHPACQGLPASFSLFEEIYEFKNWERTRVHMLLAMHRHPQTGAPGDYPLAWTSRFGNGRVFYTALGHRDDVYANELFRRHLAGGILWALGLMPGDDTRGNPVR